MPRRILRLFRGSGGQTVLVAPSGFVREFQELICEFRFRVGESSLFGSVFENAEAHIK